MIGILRGPSATCLSWYAPRSKNPLTCRGLSLLDWVRFRSRPNRGEHIRPIPRHSQKEVARLMSAGQLLRSFADGRPQPDAVSPQRPELASQGSALDDHPSHRHHFSQRSGLTRCRAGRANPGPARPGSEILLSTGDFAGGADVRRTPSRVRPPSGPPVFSLPVLGVPTELAAQRGCPCTAEALCPCHSRSRMRRSSGRTSTASQAPACPLRLTRSARARP